MSHYFAGIDIGSTITKAVIIEKEIIARVIGPTGPEQRRLANKVMEEALRLSGLSLESIAYIVSTGYGRINVPFADKQVTEISCHARGIAHLIPNARTVIDIGGQDSKAIRIDSSGRPTDFIMNDKCAAGSGRFIEVIADTLGLKLEEMGDTSLKSCAPAQISNICTIWAQQEVASRLAEGVPVHDLVAGVHKSLADRVARMVTRIKVEREVVLTGGGAKNSGLTRALSQQLGCDLLLPPDPLITGALGAALLGRDLFEKSARTGTSLPTKPRVLEEAKILSA
ncbi:MAG: 2-hydroxyglutaryl-CoA dehydratase [Deltaproteobacteria bacterium HGW-Deltaproteobacteria-15]|jgi:predicted CoA-substrate-specific enzyme activase|nr:MAG: 2-hydroxyglutaryl-CoA dehydratase [Deltaproteobacteria bacterium HGW-Deltaproteobacteria-15]